MFARGSYAGLTPAERRSTEVMTSGQELVQAQVWQAVETASAKPGFFVVPLNMPTARQPTTFLSQQRQMGR